MSKNIFKRTVQGQVKCDFCKTNLKEKRLKRHMKQFHPEIAYNITMPSIVSAKVDWQVSDSQKSSPIILKLYKCKVCGVKGIKEGTHFNQTQQHAG